MSDSWKANESIEIIEGSIIHHTRIARDKTDDFFLMYQEMASTDVIKIYSLYYKDAKEELDPYLDEMGPIQLRKIGPTITEITIPNPYNIKTDEDRNRLTFSRIKSQDAFTRNTVILERIKARERIINELLNGLEDDGLLNKKGNPLKNSITDGPIATQAFVNPNRIEELSKSVSSDFDLAKLVRICEEINSSFSNENFFSVAMLLRAVLDHVPPVFELDTFEQVVAQHGNKSFKEHMRHLDKSLRKIADSYLHYPIRKKEVLPNQNQVNFSADLDVLLAEIVRILK
ncbi:MAG: hypothetical protein HYZ22_08705 [Chloroflexi bacterium]|nr:hypothetical protein [Chloroflexota bacterium]